jgi:hypothetical protein
LAYKLAAEPDWDFMRENQSKLAFLFGIDDHWGPLQLFEEVTWFPFFSLNQNALS